MAIDHHRINQFNQLSLNKEEYIFLRNKYDIIFKIYDSFPVTGQDGLMFPEVTND